MTFRLLKIVTQTYLVEDDGEHLREIKAEPVVIDPAGLEGFPAQVAADIAALNEAAAEDDSAGS